ncbi:MAG: carboxypeptidase regulatory-like domain-containing protein, partial [Acidobacteriaceae bacterium]|nr:carboxypeptidase regulatory-like domain-containing protein [Acidobacteriaceae bacterium]
VSPPTPDASKPYGTVTDGDGKFIFEVLDPGRYTLSAERAGYLRQAYGAKAGQMNGSTLTLAPGQHMSAIAITMAPQAVLMGRVLDEDGEPMGRAQIRVLQMGYRQGKRGPIVRMGNGTDENGQFRITGLSPGRYFVCAGVPFARSSVEALRSASASHPQTKAPREDYAPTCYPNSSDVEGATLIDLPAGREVSGLDIRLRKSTVVRVKGQISGGVPGNSYDQIQVSLQSAGDSATVLFGGSVQVNRKGNFELPSVHPGSYRLVAMNYQGQTQTLGVQPLEVGTEDIQDVVLSLVPPSDLKGRIILEGDPKPPAPGETPPAPPLMHVQLYSRDVPNFYGYATAADDGTFTIANVAPARNYTLTVSVPPGGYVRSVRLGEQDMPQHSIDLSSASGSELQINVKMAAGEVDGSVTDGNSQPASGAVITIIPDPPNPELQYLYHQTRTDQNGAFQVKSVAPGNYTVYAWEELESGAQFDPDFLKPFSSKSEHVTMSENGRAQLNLTRIPAPAGGNAR